MPSSPQHGRRPRPHAAATITVLHLKHCIERQLLAVAIGVKWPKALLLVRVVTSLKGLSSLNGERYRNENRPMSLLGLLAIF